MAELGEQPVSIAPPVLAWPRLRAFARRRGKVQVQLAMYAALPTALTPELLNLIRVNFVPEAHFITEADLLLSDLVLDRGGGYYEIETDLRDLLLRELRRSFGDKTLLRVADFLYSFCVQRRCRELTRVEREFVLAQEWTALAYLRPEAAAMCLAEAMSEPLRNKDVTRARQVVALTSSLESTLRGSGAVARYAAGVERLLAGDSKAANLVFGGASGMQASQTIGEVELPPPSDIAGWVERGEMVQHDAGFTEATEATQATEASDSPQQQTRASDSPQQQTTASDSPQQQARPGIYLSYRRDDVRHVAARLEDDLEAAFGSGRVFRDMDAISPGADSTKVLNDTIDSCGVMLVLIGPRWLDLTDADGSRHLDQSDDRVRAEIASGLERDVRVVPVLIDGSKFPQESELPDNLKALTRRQAISLDVARWREDIESLVQALQKIPELGPSEIASSVEGDEIVQKGSKFKGASKTRQKQRREGIYLSYRRADVKHVAGRLADDLKEVFGSGRVFRNMDDISPGLDFTDVLKETLDSCAVMLVLIGPKWLDLADADGNRRLAEPDDFTRLEIATGLERDIAVIPVLVDETQFPRQSDLPDNIRKLSHRQAISLSDERWRGDLERLVQALRKIPELQKL